MTKTILKVLLASVFLGGVLFASDAKMPTQQNIEVSTKKEDVEKFVTVALEVSAEKQKIEQALQQSAGGEEPSEDQIQKANMEFSQKVEETIKKSELSMNEYNQYAQLLQQDPDFQKKAQDIAKEMENN